MRFARAIAFAALLLPTAATAHGYRIILAPPTSGRMLIGHAGVQAVDHRTDIALVRIVSPGNEVQQRGTVRVLVMNLGTKPFELGPEQVTLTLGDGTVLRPTSVAAFEKGRELIERESRYAGIADRQNRNNLSGLAQQQNSGMTVQSMSPGGNPGGNLPAAKDQDHASEAMSLPGAKTLDSIYQILIPQTVAPQKAWGGYYVFDMPKAAFARKADQPLTITVRTGAQEHRFLATLRWK